MSCVIVSQSAVSHIVFSSFRSYFSAADRRPVALVSTSVTWVG